MPKPKPPTPRPSRERKPNSVSDADSVELRETGPRFYLVVPPGLETAALRELKAWFPDAEPLSQERGGIEWSAPMDAGLAAPRRLKVPSRVLWRMAEFGCRDFPKLFRKTRALGWADLLPPGTAVAVEASSRSSRLRIKKRIAETVEAAIAKAVSAGERADASERAPMGPEVSVYVRFVDDVCSISLDLSGEHQHRRGTKIHSTEAPLRENAAAGFLWALAEGSGPDSERAIELMDPMCGSGTFGLEALGLAQDVRSRAFAFEALKPVREGRWRERNASAPLGVPRFARARLSDWSDKALEAARGNARQAGLSEAIEFAKEDAIDGPVVPGPSEGSVRWLTVNPPYGERLKAGDGDGGGRSRASLGEHYSRLAAALDERARPDRAGFLVPAKARTIRWPARWRQVGSPIAFSNGGIPTLFFRFRSVGAGSR